MQEQKHSSCREKGGRSGNKETQSGEPREGAPPCTTRKDTRFATSTSMKSASAQATSIENSAPKKSKAYDKQESQQVTISCPLDTPPSPPPHKTQWFEEKNRYRAPSGPKRYNTLLSPLPPRKLTKLKLGSVKCGLKFWNQTSFYLRQQADV